jgi:RNA polymerase sigma-70 factor (ECF subfamily)
MEREAQPGVFVETEDVWEEKALERFRRGEVEAFEEVVRRYQTPLYNLLYRMSRDEDETRDHLQETFLRAFRGLKDFRGGSRLGTWLYRIALNTFLKRQGKKEEEPTDPSTLEEFWHSIYEEPNPKDPAEVLMREEGKEILRQAIGRLPEEYRAVLLLRDREELSAKEVGEILDLSVAAVKSRLHRARLFLRKELQSYYAMA